jgi:hypothetical protein
MSFFHGNSGLSKKRARRCKTSVFVLETITKFSIPEENPSWAPILERMNWNPWKEHCGLYARKEE